jgi:hypothetical protein
MRERERERESKGSLLEEMSVHNDAVLITKSPGVSDNARAETCR